MTPSSSRIPNVLRGAAAVLIVFSPALSFLGGAGPTKRLFPGWPMFSGAQPVCALRFPGAGDAERETLRAEAARGPAWSHSLPPVPVFPNEGAAREFLRARCGNGAYHPGLRFDLSCYSGGAWLEVAKGEQLRCG